MTLSLYIVISKPPCLSSEMSIKSSTRIHLTVNENLEIAEEIEREVSYAALLVKDYVGVRTLTRVETKAKSLKMKLTDNALSGNENAVREQKSLVMDKKVLEFMTFCRQIKRS